MRPASRALTFASFAGREDEEHYDFAEMDDELELLEDRGGVGTLNFMSGGSSENLR